MSDRAFDLIGLDADDTLWHTEIHYRRAKERWLALLTTYDLIDDPDQVLDRVEIRNLTSFGYGVKGFVLSMVEAAVEATGSTLRACDVQRIVDLGREMVAVEVEPLDGVAETLSELRERHDLLLITKGDLMEQEAKVERSGMAGYFAAVEIVSRKTPGAYAAILERHAIDPHRFLMVGNSLRSDVLPVLAIGGQAVHIPYHLTWFHEMVSDADLDEKAYHELESIRHLPSLLRDFAA